MAGHVCPRTVSDAFASRWRRVSFLLLCCLATTRLSGIGAEATPTIRCAWTDPVSGERLVHDFSGEPFLITPPGGAVRCSLLRDGAYLPLVSVDVWIPGDERPAANRLEPPAEGARIVAPDDPGVVFVRIASSEKDGEYRNGVRLVIAVPTRARMGGDNDRVLFVNGTRLGYYGRPWLSRVRKIRFHQDAYAPPALFVPIRPECLDAEIRSGFRVADAVIPDEKTGERHAAWFPVSYRFQKELARLRDALRRAGLPVESMRYLSVFRTPDHNRSIGSTTFSRHVYGDALDFFFDGDDDGRADDVTGDGTVTVEDALAVVHAVEAAQAEGRLGYGGIGVYDFPGGSNRHRLTFHIDFRGHRAVWAYRYDRRGRRSAFEWTSRVFEKDRWYPRPDPERAVDSDAEAPTEDDAAPNDSPAGKASARRAE